MSLIMPVSMRPWGRCWVVKMLAFEVEAWAQVSYCRVMFIYSYYQTKRPQDCFSYDRISDYSIMACKDSQPR